MEPFPGEMNVRFTAGGMKKNRSRKTNSRERETAFQPMRLP